MPPAYIIANVEVRDPEAYERYRAGVPATVAQYGGAFIARGDRLQGLEGAEPKPRLVVLKFPSYEQALAWYNSEEYQPLARLRQSASEGNLVLVEGVD